MAFKKELDKELYSVKIESEDTEIQVSVSSYNDGKPKLQIGPRVFEKKDGTPAFRKMGRLTADETEKLLEVLPEALEHMKVGE